MAKSFHELVKRTTTKRTRDSADRRARELLGELLLSEVRRLAGKSQRQVAQALGIKQPSLSKLESQSDMQISTLRRIVAALGGELDVIARFPKGTVRIEQFDKGLHHHSRRRAIPAELHLV
jgi:transcriptional regulator with XRE-family HTH domain